MPASTLTPSPSTSPSPALSPSGQGFLLELVALPNPYSGGIPRFAAKVSGQPAELTLKLYTKAMALVSTETFALGIGAGAESWHTVNSSWLDLSSGLYYVVGEAGGKKATCKWVVLK